MTQPIQFPLPGGIDPLKFGAGAASGGAGAAEKSGPAFSDVLLSSLSEVQRLQDEAALGVEKLISGEATNPDEVFSAVRKADVAFSLLMEIRNKLTEAYREMQEMRV